MKIHLNLFPRLLGKTEDSIIILAQQDLSLADSGPFCTYQQRETFKDSQKSKSKCQSSTMLWL